jgi:hypothetical protein
MLPCLRDGVRSRLCAQAARAVMSRRRVVRGSMMASTNPRAAAMNGF